MHRHHPYGGGFDGPPARRGGFQDRSHRFSDRGGPSRGRGFGRGRGGGGGGGYNNNNNNNNNGGSYNGGVAAYDQGPPQGDMGGYNDYSSAPPQEIYQNGGYNAGVPGQYGSDSGGFDESYEANSSPSQGFGGRPSKRGQRRERDDKVHDSIIEERIQRERPCRTLFIRNIKYETNSDDVRRLFEEHGEIKTFFDLIGNRGMVFVTYYDLRAAERARERLQGSEISGRPIDVHYSLPRDDTAGRDKDRNQQLQGTLLVTLRNSVSGQAIDDSEVRRKFQQFGDVKTVSSVGDRTDQRYVEFYDTRACEEAHDRLRHQGLQDGVMDIVFASDNDDPRGASPRRGGEDRSYDRGRDWEDTPPSRGRRGGRGGRARGRGFGNEDWERRGDWGRDRDRSRGYDEGFGGGRGGGRYDDNFDNRNGGPGGYGPTASGPTGFGGGPPAAQAYMQQAPQAPPVDERLEQAKKVQQLLAALKQPGGGAATAPSTPSNAAPTMHSMQPSSAPPSNAYYQSPPMQTHGSYQGGVPSNSNPYPPMPPQSSAPQPATSLAGLPPNILALLHQGQGQGQPPSNTNPQMPYGIPPPQMMASQPHNQHVPGVSAIPPSNVQPGYQQLMAYLQQKR